MLLCGFLICAGPKPAVKLNTQTTVRVSVLKKKKDLNCLKCTHSSIAHIFCMDPPWEFKRCCRNRGQNSVLKVPTDLPQETQQAPGCIRSRLQSGPERDREASSNCRNQEMPSYPTGRPTRWWSEPAIPVCILGLLYQRKSRAETCSLVKVGPTQKKDVISVDNLPNRADASG